MSARNPVDRALIAELAIATRWANTPAEERPKANAKARAEFAARFERQVDPDGVLPPEERAYRAEHAKRAYYARLALRSVQARRRKAGK